MTLEEALFLFNNMEFAEKYQGKDEYAEMTLVIKQALEKQIAKKARVFSRDDNYKPRYCPSCGIRFLHWSRHCQGCGQKVLDWSEEE